MIPGQIHSRTATALAAVERALAELRRGGIVVLRDDDGAGGLVIAAEACGPRALQRLQGLAQAAPVLVTTRRRAEAIGMEIPPHIAGGMGETNKPITLDLPEGVPADVILQPHETEEAGRHAALRYLSRPVASHAPLIAETAIELAKLARLLPAVVLGPLTRDPKQQAPRLGARPGPGLCRCRRRAGLRGDLGAQPAAGGAGARAARGRGERPHPRLASERRRQGASRHRRRRDRSHRAGADPAALRMLHRRPSGLAALRLRRAAARRHRRDRQAGLGRAALSRAGGPRHRPGQQAARVRTAGRRLRHDRRQRAAGLRRRRAHLRAGRHHAVAHGHQARAAA